MRGNLETALRAKGASDTLLRLLKEEDMLTSRRLDSVARGSLQARLRSRQTSIDRDISAGGGHARQSIPSRTRHSEPPAPEAPAAHLEVLAAIALSYL